MKSEKSIVPLKTNKTALITGITGQDGSYLAEFLLYKGYTVHGLLRKSSSYSMSRIEHLYTDIHNEGARLFLHYGDLTDSGSLTNLFYAVKPDEVYHLGAQSHVRVSFDMPEYTGNVTGLSTVRMLEAIKRSGIKTRFYQASSSEMFGATPPPQNENSLFYPRSPYAVAKIYSYWMTINSREADKIFACNGILFNHESPRRGESFVTRKVTKMAAQILSGKSNKIYLGNLNSRRDWGYAPEYVEAMHAILQQDSPDDFVLGTGNIHSVREFVEAVFKYLEIEIQWQGEGGKEKGIIRSLKPRPNCKLKKGDVLIEIDPYYLRPTEVNGLQADYAKAKRILGWEPKVSFGELVKIMVDYDLESAHLASPGEGRKITAAKGITWIQVD